MKKQSKIFINIFRRLMLVFAGTLMTFLMYSCEKDNPKPPDDNIQPMYGAPSCEYKKADNS